MDNDRRSLRNRLSSLSIASFTSSRSALPVYSAVDQPPDFQAFPAPIPPRYSASVAPSAIASPISPRSDDDDTQSLPPASAGVIPHFDYTFHVRQSKPWASLHLFSRVSMPNAIQDRIQKPRHPTYWAGDNVSGIVELNIASPQAIQAITITVRGKILTSFLDGGTHTFFTHELPIWHRQSGDPNSPSETPTTDSLPSLTSNSKKKWDGKLSGSYQFPFSFDLPSHVDLASSTSVIPETFPRPFSLAASPSATSPLSTASEKGRRRVSPPQSSFSQPSTTGPPTTLSLNTTNLSPPPSQASSSQFLSPVSPLESPISPLSLPTPVSPLRQKKSTHHFFFSSSSSSSTQPSEAQTPSTTISPLPQTYVEQSASITIQYDLTLSITHPPTLSLTSALPWLKRPDVKIRTPLTYVPTTIPTVRMSSARRSACISESVSLPSPGRDLKGWFGLPPVVVEGWIGGRSVKVIYNLFMAKPLCYTRGTVLPLYLVVSACPESETDRLVESLPASSSTTSPILFESGSTSRSAPSPHHPEQPVPSLPTHPLATPPHLTPLALLSTPRSPLVRLTRKTKHFYPHGGDGVAAIRQRDCKDDYSTSDGSGRKSEGSGPRGPDLADLPWTHGADLITMGPLGAVLPSVAHCARKSDKEKEKEKRRKGSKDLGRPPVVGILDGGTGFSSSTLTLGTLGHGSMTGSSSTFVSSAPSTSSSGSDPASEHANDSGTTVSDLDWSKSCGGGGWRVSRKVVEEAVWWRVLDKEVENDWEGWESILGPAATRDGSPNDGFPSPPTSAGPRSTPGASTTTDGNGTTRTRVPRLERHLQGEISLGKDLQPSCSCPLFNLEYYVEVLPPLAFVPLPPASSSASTASLPATSPASQPTIPFSYQPCPPFVPSSSSPSTTNTGTSSTTPPSTSSLHLTNVRNESLVTLGSSSNYPYPQSDSRQHPNSPYQTHFSGNSNAKAERHQQWIDPQTGKDPRKRVLASHPIEITTLYRPEDPIPESRREVVRRKMERDEWRPRPYTLGHPEGPGGGVGPSPLAYSAGIDGNGAMNEKSRLREMERIERDRKGSDGLLSVLGSSAVNQGAPGPGPATTTDPSTGPLLGDVKVPLGRVGGHEPGRESTRQGLHLSIPSANSEEKRRASLGNLGVTIAERERQRGLMGPPAFPASHYRSTSAGGSSSGSSLGASATSSGSSATSPSSGNASLSGPLEPPRAVISDTNAAVAAQIQSWKSAKQNILWSLE